MKLSEVIVEHIIDDMLEEGGEDYENAALLTILSYLQNRAADTHKQPRIRADALINLVQDAGYPQFNFDTLVNVAKNNENVKSIIKDIKDVTVQVNDDGKVDVGGGAAGGQLVKYVYINPVDDQDTDLDTEQDSAPTTAPEKKVDAMAKRAAKARS